MFKKKKEEEKSVCVYIYIYVYIVLLALHFREILTCDYIVLSSHLYLDT